jgi:hypothetical protein
VNITFTFYHTCNALCVFKTLIANEARAEAEETVEYLACEVIISNRLVKKILISSYCCLLLMVTVFRWSYDWLF